MTSRSYDEADEDGVMSLERNWSQVERFLAELEDVRMHERPGGRRWELGHRLVARQIDHSTLLIRSDFGTRERLLDTHPETFSMRPDLEAHMKVLADMDDGDVSAICSALRDAWEMQRG